jgi:hypothetical protein
VVPNWDNTPRCGKGALVFDGSSPALFQGILREALHRIEGLESEERLIFVKSWNEWAEGNYLEPDRYFGTRYLAAIRDLVLR